MQWAKEEAQRREFDPQSKDIHLVMDGETCLRDRMRERFPNATIALDIRHAEEHLHAMGKLIHTSSEDRETFVENYRAMLYDGKARKMTEELQGMIEDANKQKKKDGLDPDDCDYQELEKAIAYFAKRIDMKQCVIVEPVFRESGWYRIRRFSSPNFNPNPFSSGFGVPTPSNHTEFQTG